MLLPRSKRWLESLEALLLPATCRLCGAEPEPRRPVRDICAACVAALPWNLSACQRCGLPLPSPEPACGACLRRPPQQGATIAPLLYQAPLDRLLPALKFHDDLAAARLLATLMLDDPRVGDALRDCDAVIAVPLGTARLRQRGFNQAQEIARALAGAADRPLLAAALTRIRATATQVGQSARLRRANVRRAFAATDAVQGRAVVLVDDVATTGATIDDASRALLAAGARQVIALVAARTPPAGWRT